MSQYAWVSFNNAKIDWICHHIDEKKQSTEYVKFWMCLMQYIAWVSVFSECPKMSFYMCLRPGAF